MIFKRGLLCLFLGASASLTGCFAEPEGAGSPEDMPRLSTMAGLRGSTGTNGLSTLSFNLYKDALHGSARSPLAGDSEALRHTIRATSSNNALLQNAAGREVLEYAARCGLAEGDWIAGGTTSQTFLGGGILTTTQGWPVSGLSASQEEDLFTCVLAHLNFYNTHVPIFLSGPSIASMPGDDASQFTVDEAVWSTKITKNILGMTVLEFDVWPQIDLANLCGTILGSVLGARVCGVGVLCGLVVRTDFASACVRSGDGYVCDGRPAIETRLTPQGAGLLYPLCGQ